MSLFPGGKDGGSGVPDLPDQQVTEGDGGQQPEETVDDAKGDTNAETFHRAG